MEIKYRMVVETRKYLNYIKRQFFSGKKLNFLILYVTSKCNSQCRTCFFHGRLNKDTDLSLEEFKRISENLGNISILLIGGGEPFLQPDLEEICSEFIEKNRIDTLYIPTNGFLTERVLAVAEMLVKKFPAIVLSINPSLDGMSVYHDELRGIKGGFNQTIKTIEGLTLLKKKYKNLQIIVNSVVQRENIDDLKKLAVYLRKFDLDYHAFEIMRGDPRDKKLVLADPKEVKKIHEFILENRRWYLDKNSRKPRTTPLQAWPLDFPILKHSSPLLQSWLSVLVRGKNIFFNFLNRVAVLGHMNYTQRLKEAVLAGKRWPVRCAAGESIAAVYPNGDVALCELLEPVGNLRNYGYSLNEILNSPVAQKQRETIRKTRCSCTHICFINASIARDPKTIFKLPYFYLQPF